MIKRYSTTPEVVEAALVTESNLEELARWCGGNPEGSYGIGKIVVPTLNANNLVVVLGSYLVKNLETGRFSGMSVEAFSKFHEVGLRQDGVKTFRGGTVSTDPGPIAVNSGEAYGAYADPRYQMDYEQSRPYEVKDELTPAQVREGGKQLGGS